MKKFNALLITILMLSLLVTSTATVSAEYQLPPLYSDVPGNFWAYDAIKYASDRSWFNGYSDGSFLPDNTITRAESLKVLVTYLYRDLKVVSVSSFPDVDSSAWYLSYVETGYDLLPGTAIGKPIRPDEAITREDAIYALVRYLNLNRIVDYVDVSRLDGFLDADDLNNDLKPYIAIAIQTGLISGYSDGTIKGKKPLTRAEFATLLHRAAILREKNKAKFAKTTEEEFEIAEANKIAVIEENANAMATGDFQAQVVSLVNDIRKENGLNELTICLDLTKIAQMKAEDMYKNDYFDHVSPTYGTPFEMLESSGVFYERSAGENIAQGQSNADAVVSAWMCSEGYRKNIIKESYKKIGVGYVPESSIWVQLFIG